MEGSWLSEWTPATFDSDFKAAVLAGKRKRAFQTGATSVNHRQLQLVALLLSLHDSVVMHHDSRPNLKLLRNRTPVARIPCGQICCGLRQGGTCRSRLFFCLLVCSLFLEEKKKTNL